jgi:hypothetical protein
MFITVYTTAFQLSVFWAINPVYSLPNYFFKTRFNIIFPSEPPSSTCSPFFRFPYLKPCRLCFLSCICHMPLLCHVTRLDDATQWLSAQFLITIKKRSWRLMSGYFIARLREGLVNTPILFFAFTHCSCPSCLSERDRPNDLAKAVNVPDLHWMVFGSRTVTFCTSCMSSLPERCLLALPTPENTALALSQSFVSDFRDDEHSTVGNISAMD